MYARWGSFAVGLALLLAPLVLGYGSVAAILHDVAMGSLVCVATLAALQWPRARFALAVPGLWLVAFAQATPDGAGALADLVAGALLLVLAPFPSGRVERRPVGPGPRTGRSGARA
jgi:hypothetical protein